MSGGVPVKERIYSAFKKIGYEIRSPEDLKKSFFCAEDFGVPQKRNRIIIIGIPEKTKQNLDDFYDSLEKRKSSERKTVRDAIGGLPKLYPLDVIDETGRSK